MEKFKINDEDIPDIDNETMEELRRWIRRRRPNYDYKKDKFLINDCIKYIELKIKPAILNYFDLKLVELILKLAENPLIEYKKLAKTIQSFFFKQHKCNFLIDYLLKKIPKQY